MDVHCLLHVRGSIDKIEMLVSSARSAAEDDGRTHSSLPGMHYGPGDCRVYGAFEALHLIPLDAEVLIWSYANSATSRGGSLRAKLPLIQLVGLLKLWEVYSWGC